MAVLGLNNWRGKNSHGGLTALADWNHIALNNRNVIICFDSDVMEKYEVQHALKTFRKWLEFKNANVDFAYLPVSEDGKNSIDDYLAAGHTLEDLQALVKAPRPEIQPAPPKLKILFTEPAEMRRPLIVHDGLNNSYSYCGHCHQLGISTGIRPLDCSYTSNYTCNSMVEIPHIPRCASQGDELGAYS